MKAQVVAIAAMTIDGKIALHSRHFTDWTSREDKSFLRAVLDDYEVIVLGNNTYQIGGAAFSKRKCIVLTRSNQTAQGKDGNLIFWSPTISSIEAVLEPFRKVALLGGTQTYSYFLERDLIDELYLTIEPVVFGKGLNLFDCRDDLLMKFRLVSVRNLNETGTILLHYGRRL